MYKQKKVHKSKVKKCSWNLKDFFSRPKGKAKHKAVATKAVATQKLVIRGADPNKIKLLENDIRDIINLLAVFEKEQDLLPDSTKEIKERLYALANKLGRI